MEVDMDEMKSAFERAMERAESLGKASEEDLKKWKYIPEGEKLAARYMKDECDLMDEMDKYDAEARQHVMKGAQEVLVRNIDLPRNDMAKKASKKAMEAIKELKQDKVSLENVYTKLRRVFSHYEQEGEQQRRQAYEAVKRDVEGKLQQALQQQTGAAGAMKIDVESQPQFQQEWLRVLGQLDAQYMTLIEECRQEIRAIT
jgi:hypothetical protein